MSTDPNPYSPPQTAVKDVLREPPALPRGPYSVWALWLSAAYCILGPLLQLFMAGRLLRGNLFLLSMLSVYVRFVPVFLTMGAGVALLQRARFSAGLLLSLLIIQLEFRFLSAVSERGYLFLADPLILMAITVYAYVLRGRGVLRPAPALPGALSAAGIYCMVPGLLHLAVVTPMEVEALTKGNMPGSDFLVAVAATAVRVLAGFSLLWGSRRGPDTLVVLCAVCLLRIAVAVFWPFYLPMQAVLLSDLAVLAVITRHAFVLRKRGVLTGLHPAASP